MLVRSKQGERNIKWRRPVRGSHSSGHSGTTTQNTPAQRERLHGGPSEDRALYSCECGYAFEAVVTTSVGCPHCERTQAW